MNSERTDDHLQPVININEIIIDYELELGRGTCGTVWFKGNYIHSTVAVKKILHSMKNDDLDMFWKEVSIMSQIRHPNILNIMGACRDNKCCLIITELLPNNLQYMLDKATSNGESNDLTQALKMAQDIATGMQWLHGYQPSITHGYLKPANILIDQCTNAKIADFGLSFINQERDRLDLKVLASQLWKAPEALELKPPKPSVDVYSFSIILFQLFTFSSLPYKIEKYKDDVSLFIRDIIQNKKRPKFPEDLYIPPSLVLLIEKCWHHNPNLRPTFTDIITELKYIKFLHNDETSNRVFSNFYLNSSVSLIFYDYKTHDSTIKNYEVSRSESDAKFMDKEVKTQKITSIRPMDRKSSTPNIPPAQPVKRFSLPEAARNTVHRESEENINILDSSNWGAPKKSRRNIPRKKFSAILTSSKTSLEIKSFKKRTPDYFNHHPIQKQTCTEYPPNNKSKKKKDSESEEEKVIIDVT